MCSFIQEAKTICENHSSNTHDKAKAESRGAPVFLPALAITDLAARALCPRAQLPFPGSCPHHPHSVSILLPTFLFIKRLLDVSKYCRQACFVWFGLFCWRGTHCSREMYCTHKAVLPTKVRLPCWFTFPPCFSRNPAAHLAPSARENGGSGSRALVASLRHLFLKDRGRASGVSFGVNLLTVFYFTAVGPKPGRAPTVIGGKF